MLHKPLLLATLTALTLTSSLAAAQAKPGWTLTFDDEFSETALDTTKWGTQYKWGASVINGEVEAYTTSAFSFNAGIMSINATATPATYGGQQMQYSSGLIASVFEQQYGYFEMRAQLPKGQGVWPAFWLLHDTNVPTNDSIAELDIMEMLGATPTTIYSTVHWGTNYTTDSHQDQVVSTEPDTSAAFHTYGVEWNATTITWYFDGNVVHTYSGAGVPQCPMYIIANVALGGSTSWGGALTPSVLPVQMQIDYIRAYLPAADAGASDAGSDVAAVDSTPADTGSVANDVAATDTGATTTAADSNTTTAADSNTTTTATDSPTATDTSVTTTITDSATTTDAAVGTTTANNGCSCDVGAASASWLPGAWAMLAIALAGRRRARKAK